MIVVVFGLPGSGKSYFAERLAEVLQGTYLSTDRLRKEEFDHGDYSLKAKEMVYERMIEIGKEQLSKGENIVFDGTFFLERLRRKIVENFAHLSNIHFIEVLTSEKLTKERTERKRAYSSADFEVHKKIKQVFEPMRAPHLLLTSTNDNIEEMMAKAVKHMNLKQML